LQAEPLKSCVEPLKSFKANSLIATSTQMTNQIAGLSPQKKPDFGINVSGSVRQSKGNRPQTAAVARAYHDRIQG
jgi:hypothetical protein